MFNTIDVKYTSSGKSPSGYGSAARVDIAALFCSGVNLTTETIQQTAETTDYGIEGKIMDSLEGRDIPYKIQIVHLTPDLIPQYKQEGIYTISRLAWETDKLPKEWINPLNEIDEIWTMSPQMVEMIHKSGVTTPCFNFPEPINITKATERIDSFQLKFPKDFIFYTIGQWIDRKNFRGLLRAYWRAFEGEERVSLMIKTHRTNYSESEYSIIKRDIMNWKNELKLKHFPKILLVRQLMNDKQVNKLHQLGDCYISPSAGEGWGRPIQEAMLYGKPVIAGDVGGITDIMTTQHYYVVSSKSYNATEVSHIPWYTRDQKWKLLDEDVLGIRMKEVFKNYSDAMKVGEKAQKYVIENFSFQEVGRQMKARLSDISKSL